MHAARLTLVVLAAAWTAIAAQQAMAQDPAEPEPKATFGGPPEGPRRIVYVCNGGQSMGAQCERVKDELRRSIVKLKPNQLFNVIFAPDDAPAAAGERLLTGTPDNKKKALAFLDSYRPHGKADFVAALKLAMQDKPQLIFLLSDKELGDGEALLKYLREANADKAVRIHALGVSDGDEKLEETLRNVAKENGGLFKRVTEFGAAASRPTSAPATTSVADEPVARFGGFNASAESIVLVCDAGTNNKVLLDQELRRCIGDLSSRQRFNLVYFAADAPSALDRTALLPASEANKRKAAEFMSQVKPQSKTNPIPAIDLALACKPRAIILITDGDFPDNKAVVEWIRAHNQEGRIRVNGLRFLPDPASPISGEKVLKQIADENAGVYKSVSREELGH